MTQRILPLFGFAAMLATNHTALADNAGPSDPRAIIAQAEAVPPGGIDELKTVELGGLKQWIHVRGSDRANPILLFLHGGPGAPMMPESWVWQRPWEDFFTIVQWDQRSAGKTLASAGLKPDPNLTIAQMQTDAEQLIALLRQTYGQKKIFLLGHSWGSILGLRVAQSKPEWLYAYIGVGQVVNGQENERVGYQETLARAVATGDQAAVAALKALAPYPDLAAPAPITKLAEERKWNVALGGMRYGQSVDNASEIWKLSPDYTDADVKAAQLSELASVQILLPQLAQVDFTHVTKFACPVVIFAGAEDRTTPESLAERYFNTIEAPQKKFFKVEKAAHYVMIEAQGEMLLDMVRDVRTLARDSR